MFKGYFIFNRGERIGIIVFLFFILLGTVIYIFMDRFIKPATTDFTAFKKQIKQFNLEQDSINQVRKESYKLRYANKYGKTEYNKKEVEQVPFKPFEFNPNTIAAEKFKELGFKDWQIKTIENYRAKGGQFRQKEDLNRIYGMTPEHYNQIEPYVNIPKQEPIYSSNNSPKPKIEIPKAVVYLDLNRSKKEELMQIKGVGSAFSERIIKYRNSLGGFKNKTQLKEVYGITDEIYQQIETQIYVTNIIPKKLNINILKSEELKEHPYVNWNLANSIVNYRQKHGEFSAVSEIKKLHLVTDELYDKLEPYITVK